VRIVESAHRHGVGDDAILAALAVPMRRVRLEDDLLLVIEPTPRHSSSSSSWPTRTPTTPA
jgi:hypothetical protein